MSSSISAPHPSNKTTIVLPSEKFRDAKASESSIDIKRSMNGERVFTYVKSTTRQTVTLPFVLTRPKYLELVEFARVYRAALMLLTLSDGTQWVGNLVTQPITGRQTTGSAVEVDLEFSVSQYFQPLG